MKAHGCGGTAHIDNAGNYLEFFYSKGALFYGAVTSDRRDLPRDNLFAYEILDPKHPVPGGEVRLKSGDEVRRTSIDSQGTFAINGLKGGEYELWVDSPGYTPVGPRRITISRKAARARRPC